jgi:ABC-type transporter MlaC component
MDMSHRQALAATAFAVSMILPCPGLADPAAEASAALSAMNAELIAIIRDEAVDPSRRRPLVEHFLTSNLDLTRMVTDALGPYFELMSKTQFAEFSREYSHFLTYVYLQEMSWVRRDGGDFEIVGAELDPKSGEVELQTRAAMRPSMANVPDARQRRSNRTVFEGSFRMSQRRGRWNIVAMRFNGVDLNRVFAAQFAAMLERRSPDSLIEELRKRNRENADKDPFAEGEGRRSR